MNMTKLYRIQFEMPESKVKDLEALMSESGTQTKKEIFNNALTLLEWAVKETKRKRVIASVDEGTATYNELHMPILSAVTAAADATCDSQDMTQSDS
jgi:hypothetical protein